MEEPPTELALKDAVGLLTDHDAPKGRNAMATLIAGGDRSLPLLASHLEFESQPDGLDPRIQQLIRDLDSDHFFTREKATKKLAALGARARTPLVGAPCMGRPP